MYLTNISKERRALSTERYPTYSPEIALHYSLHPQHSDRQQARTALSVATFQRGRQEDYWGDAFPSLPAPDNMFD
jgi:hypothetical protein